MGADMWEYAIIDGPGILLEHGITGVWNLEGFIYKEFSGPIDVIMRPRPDIVWSVRNEEVFHGGSVDPNDAEYPEKIWSDYM